MKAGFTSSLPSQIDVQRAVEIFPSVSPADLREAASSMVSLHGCSAICATLRAARLERDFNGEIGPSAAACISQIEMRTVISGMIAGHDYDKVLTDIRSDLTGAVDTSGSQPR